MLRRLFVAYLVLDTAFALGALALAPGLVLTPESDTAYVEIAGTCVEEAATDDAGLGGRPVPMSLCTGV